MFDFDPNATTAAPVHRSQATAEAALAAEAPAHSGTLDERVETAGRDECDNCHYSGSDLFHNEVTGLSLCERCDAVATDAVETQPVTWKRLRNGAWGVTGPAALLVQGAQVVVTKRSGATQVKRVSRVLWSGTDRQGREISIATVGRA